MTIWGKLYRALFVRTKCEVCRSPLKGDRAETCSPACDEMRVQLAAW